MTTSLGPNQWSGWEQDVLTAAGLKVTKSNVAFLAAWGADEHSGTSPPSYFNPLNVTGYKNASGSINTYGTNSINGDGVQSYATKQQGVAATVAFLNMPNYTAVKAALASGNPVGYLIKSPIPAGQTEPALVTAVRTWNTQSFANTLAKAYNDWHSGGTLDKIGGAVGGAVTGAAGAVGGAASGVATGVGDALHPGRTAERAANAVAGSVGGAITGAVSDVEHAALRGLLYFVFTVGSFGLVVLAISRMTSSSGIGGRVGGGPGAAAAFGDVPF